MDVHTRSSTRRRDSGLPPGAPGVLIASANSMDGMGAQRENIKCNEFPELFQCIG